MSTSPGSYTITLPQFESGVLRATLKNEPAAPALSLTHELLLSSARQGGPCRFWLLDVSQHEAPLHRLPHWLEPAMSERTTQLLNGPVCIAYLIAPAHWLPAAELNLPALRHRAAEANCYFAVFDHAAQALRWLRDQQELELAEAYTPDYQI